jgi:hypothetical protein
MKIKIELLAREAKALCESVRVCRQLADSMQDEEASIAHGALVALVKR